MPDNTPTDIDSGTLAERLDRVTLIDVREHAEVSHGRIAGAHHIPMNEIVASVDSHPALRDRESEIVVYCAHGIRSDAVVRYLRERGFSCALHLTGGYVEWKLTAHRGRR